MQQLSNWFSAVALSSKWNHLQFCSRAVLVLKVLWCTCIVYTIRNCTAIFLHEYYIFLCGRTTISSGKLVTNCWADCAPPSCISVLQEFLFHHEICRNRINRSICIAISVQCVHSQHSTEQKDHRSARHSAITMDHDARRSDSWGPFFVPRVSLFCLL